jgi:hypothetical protein
MDSDYIEEYILLGYFAANQKAGTDKQRSKLSETLFKRYDDEIRQRAKDANVSVSKEARSIMAVLAFLSPGNDTADQAGNAVSEYQKYVGV